MEPGFFKDHMLKACVCQIKCNDWINDFPHFASSQIHTSFNRWNNPQHVTLWGTALFRAGALGRLAQIGRVSLQVAFSFPFSFPFAQLFSLWKRAVTRSFDAFQNACPFHVILHCSLWNFIFKRMTAAPSLWERFKEAISNKAVDSLLGS